MFDVFGGVVRKLLLISYQAFHHRKSVFVWKYRGTKGKCQMVVNPRAYSAGSDCKKEFVCLVL